MDTRFLETFVAVAEKGSFAEAARRLDLRRLRLRNASARLNPRSASRCCPGPAGL